MFNRFDYRFLLFAFFLFFLSWVSILSLGPNNNASVLAAFSLVIVIFMFYFRDINFFWYIFYFSFSHFFVVVSNVYIETGIYISEQFTVSYATGSTLRAVTYTMLFLLSAFFAFGCFRRDSVNPSDYMNYRAFRKSVFLVYFFLFSILILFGFLGGVPILDGITRFDYWRDHPFPWLRTVHILFNQTAFFLGILYFSENFKNRKHVGGLLALMFLVNFFYGDKFSLSFNSLIAFFVGYFTFRGSDFRGFRKYLLPFLYGVLVIFFFYFLIRWVYINIDLVSESAVGGYILDRAFGLQGHTWWGVDKIVSSNGFNPNLGNLFKSHDASDPGGLYLLMYAISPAFAVDFYLENGISFTMGGWAMPIYSLGYFYAVFYVMFAGVFVGLTLVYIYKKSRQYQFFRLFVALRLLWLQVLSFNMGNAYLLFEFTSFLYISLILVDVIVLKGRSFAFFRFI